jgi:NAD(P)-dependent dehydrogenase (short-subunit alcohol dehydrogenase family)
MKILIVGASGVLGKAAVAELSKRHEIVTASRTSGDVQIDLSDTASIKEAFEKVGPVDAVVAAMGSVHFGDFNEMHEDEYYVGIKNKMMAQINLVLIGRDYINPNGSFTLTTGILNRDPIRFGSSAAMVNGAIDAFVKASALEMPNGIRINVVSPTVIEEAMGKYAPYFLGHQPVPAARAALGYAKSIEGLHTGECIIIDHI